MLYHVPTQVLMPRKKPKHGQQIICTVQRKKRLRNRSKPLAGGGVNGPLRGACSLHEAPAAQGPITRNVAGEGGVDLLQEVHLHNQ